MWSSDAPRGRMNSIAPECTPLKHAYDTCFMHWFREQYLPGHDRSTRTPCKQLFLPYQQCLQVPHHFFHVLCPTCSLLPCYLLCSTFLFPTLLHFFVSSFASPTFVALFLFPTLVYFICVRWLLHCTNFEDFYKLGLPGPSQYFAINVDSRQLATVQGGWCYISRPD